MLRWGLLFVSVTSLELILLLQFGKLLGIPATIGMILFTGFLGAHLTRQQGIKTLFSIQQALQAGEMPTKQLLDGVLILIAGAFLLTPGILTDILGFSLLTPMFRGLIYAQIEDRMRRWLSTNTQTIIIER